MKALRSKSPVERRFLIVQSANFQPVNHRLMPPFMGEAAHTTLSLARRVYDYPGLIINPRTHMAWRPYENLIDGELDNRTPGRVTGWMRFVRFRDQPLKVRFDLQGDFHEDIRGKVIRLSNPNPMDRNVTLEREGTYLEGFASMQRGDVGDITAGLTLGKWTKDLSQKLLAEQELQWEETDVSATERERSRHELAESHRKHIEKQELYYPYVPYPYIEWYSVTNGRVVLELDPEQVEILSGVGPWRRAAVEPLFEERTIAPIASAFLKSAAVGQIRGRRRSDVTTPKAEQANE